MGVCSITKCDKKYYAKNYCEMHYVRVRKHGDPSIVKRKITHNKTGTHIHWIWKAMLDRCKNPKNKRYRRYGGRGIKVCDEWKGNNGFSNFYACVGDKPSGKSLDRINNNGNYEPDNVRWATYKQQSLNRNVPIKTVKVQ